MRAITQQQNEIDQIDGRLRQIDEVEGGCGPQRSRPGAVVEPARGGAARRESACTGCAVRYTDTRGARGGTPTPGSTSPCACRRAASCETHATRATTASMSPACAATRSARAAPGFQDRYNTTAKPFDWIYTRDDLNVLHRLARHTAHPGPRRMTPERAYGRDHIAAGIPTPATSLAAPGRRRRGSSPSRNDLDTTDPIGRSVCDPTERRHIQQGGHA